MAAIRALVAVATMAVLIELSLAATNHTVGQPGGSWDLQTKLTAWASSQTFTVGDNLIFSYDKSSHNVLEVNKADYTSCTTSKPISTNSNGTDVVSLSSATTRYFICGIPGHCPGGMKIQVNVVASPSKTPPPSSSPAPSSPGKTPPSSSSPPPTTPAKTPPSSSSPPPSSTGAPPPSSTTAPPPPQGSGSNGMKAKTTMGFGIGVGVLILLAL